MNKFGAKIRYSVVTFSEFRNLISPTCSMDFFTVWLLVTCLNWVHCLGDWWWLGRSYVNNTPMICCLVQGRSERGQPKGQPRRRIHYELHFYTSCLEGSENMCHVVHQARKAVWPVNAWRAIHRYQNHLHGITNHQTQLRVTPSLPIIFIAHNYEVLTRV